MQSNLALKNILAFPGKESAEDSLRRRTQGKPCEVFAIKRREDIRALQRYFLDRKQYRNYLYTVIGVSTGLRGGDIVKLRWCDVMYPDRTYKEPQEAWVQERKTGKFRYLVFHDDVKLAFDFYLKHAHVVPNFTDPRNPDYYIFRRLRVNSNYGDSPYVSREAMGKVLKAAAKAVGIQYNVNTHSLRKTFGYRFYKETSDVAMLQHILNHSSPAITLRYIGILAEDEAAAIKSLESINAFMSDDSTDD